MSPTEIKRLLGATIEMGGVAIAHSLAQALMHLTAVEAGLVDQDPRRLMRGAATATRRAAQ